MTDPTPAQDAGATWLAFTIGTFCCWGLYGIFLHRGQVLMADAANGRYKAFLFVGIAYVLTAVLAPIAVLILQKASWQMTGGGMAWSLFAGVVGAAGAFLVLMAFGAGGSPAVVMSVVFAGAPIVNAIVAITMAGTWSKITWQFGLGVLMAAAGAFLVVTYKPPAH